jgi:hypothetical protein
MNIRPLRPQFGMAVKSTKTDPALPEIPVNTSTRQTDTFHSGKPATTVVRATDIDDPEHQVVFTLAPNGVLKVSSTRPLKEDVFKRLTEDVLQFHREKLAEEQQARAGFAGSALAVVDEDWTAGSLKGNF